MDVVLHRIEALPGVGRYAVSFRRSDGSEQTAVVLATEGDVAVAEASLPAGWTRESEQFIAVAAAVLAVDHARTSAPRGNLLRDVEGGWDVGLGNVELGADAIPVCIAHGVMAELGDIWTCADCGAQAIVD